MIRKIVKLAVFLLLANAVFQTAPVAYRNMRFKDALHELVLYGQKSGDADLIARALALAAESGVPLEREYVGVRREAGSVHIDASYVEPVHLLPGYTYLWQFDIDARALDLGSAAPPRRP